MIPSTSQRRKADQAGTDLFLLMSGALAPRKRSGKQALRDASFDQAIDSNSGGAGFPESSGNRSGGRIRANVTSAPC